MGDTMDAGASAEEGLRFRPAAAESGAGAAALKKELIERGVRFLLPSYADMHGASKAKMVPISHFDRMMGGSELFTGAALDGVPQEVNEEEVAAHPDPDHQTRRHLRSRDDRHRLQSKRTQGDAGLQRQVGRGLRNDL